MAVLRTTLLLLALGSAGAALPESGLWGEAEVAAGPVVCFDVAADTAGRLWVAAAGNEGPVRLYRSDDLGRTWTNYLEVTTAAPAMQLELLAVDAESSRLYLFILERSGDGDLWVARISPDTIGYELLPVSVGVDTVDDFSAVADRDSQYYLYCLYANEHRAGRTGSFVRSTDRGLNWGEHTDWWNGWDPHLAYTSGSTIHSVWRYALTGAQIHYAYNRHYGAAGYWGYLRVASIGLDDCRDPVVAQAESVPEWQAPAWIFYTVARRDSSWRDVAYSLSNNDGGDWRAGDSFYNRYIDEWAPDAGVDQVDGRLAAVCYNYGGPRLDDSACVFVRIGTVSDPTYWTGPRCVSTGRANDKAGPTGPRLLFRRDRVWRSPGVAYCRKGATGPERVVFSAPWLGSGPQVAGTQEPMSSIVRGQATVRFDVTSAGTYRLTVIDAVGRLARRPFAGQLAPGRHGWQIAFSGLAPGTYFAELSGPVSRQRARFVVLH